MHLLPIFLGCAGSDGVVTAFDMHPAMLTRVQAKAQAAGLTNIRINPTAEIETLFEET